MASAQERARARVEALIAKIAEGDRAAFSRLYDQTSAKLYGTILRILMDRDAAEDVLQDVYARIWHGASRYKLGVTHPMTWLIVIARRAAIDRLRQRRAEDAPLDAIPEIEDAAMAAADAPPDPAAEARRGMAACLARLDPAQAAALRAAYLEGDSYPVLAARYDLPVTTMRTALRQSLLALRDGLGR